MKMPAQDVEEKLENKVRYSFHINIFTGISHSLDATSTELVSPLLAAYTKENQNPQFKRTALCVTFILITRYGKKKNLDISHDCGAVVHCPPVDRLPHPFPCQPPKSLGLIHNSSLTPVGSREIP